MATTNALAHNAASEATSRFRQLIEVAGDQLVRVQHRTSGSYIQMPLLYPSGGSVVVMIDGDEKRFFVSDRGLGHQEAEMMGAGAIFMRGAHAIAERSGVRFDNHAFFVAHATAAQLPSVIATIANCSHEAVRWASYKMSERRLNEDEEILFDRVTNIFGSKRVSRETTVRGASNFQWKISILVMPDGARRSTIFEPVSAQHVSVVNAAAKFHDIGNSDSPPNRVAVVKNRQALGDYLPVLTQAASVIERSASDKAYEKVSMAA